MDVNPETQLTYDNLSKEQKEIIEQEELLDFAEKNPLVFYKRLDEEINKCYSASLPNASLMLSRKMIENLLYHIMKRNLLKTLLCVMQLIKEKVMILVYH